MIHLQLVADKIKEIYTKVGCRHIQTFLIFLCMTVCFMMRVTMSVVIVAMTQNNTRNGTASDYTEVYNWDKKTQDIVLSSFLWGYMTMMIPGGRLAEKYGSKPLFIVTLVVNGLASLMMPWAVRWADWKGACVCRAIQGITQSSIFPGLNAFGSRWFPSTERSRLLGLVSSGSSLGTILGMLISSNIAFAFGWPCVFYAFGCLGLSVGILWCCFASSTPSCHKSITEKEKSYIESSGCANKTKAPRIPWKSILTSVPYLAIVVAHIGSDFGHIMFFMEIPSYMHKVLGMQMQKNGLFSALPYVAAWCTTIVMSFTSDFIVNKNIINRNISRKIFNTLGTWVPALLIIALSFVPSNRPYVVITLLTIGVGFSSSVTMGYVITVLDMAPNFSGTLVGVSNCVSQCISIFAPISVGFVLKDDTDPSQWRIIFIMMAVIYFITNTVYISFGSSQLQEWNDTTPSLEKDAEQGEKNKQRRNLPSIIVFNEKYTTLQI